jgi:hypothetical protein
VGAGRSQEAAYELKASIPAGTYHCVLDSIIITPVDVRYELIHRSDTDTVLASWERHWDPMDPNLFEAQAYEVDQTAAAVSFETGDKLVFRYTGLSGTMTDSYVPNGDGHLSNGRIPHITLPR